ncbi:MAG: ATP synthase F1 subunit delta [Oscillospiraceae bacterium]|nr:ATP synthase F1 subunit delta [Oscillospiraceae bacterium]
MTQIGTTYAQGLYALAKEENLTGSILEELTALKQSFEQEPAFLQLLSAPNLPKQERTDILDKSFRGKVQPYVLNFLKILTEKGYIRYFSDCCAAYRARYNEDHGILVVRAVSAVALSDRQKQQLSEKLQTMTGKTVELDCKINPAVLGGIRLDYDGKQVDGTVQNRLESMAKLLKNTVL